MSIPKTTDELLAAVPKIKAAGYDVFAASTKDDGGKFTWRVIWQAAMTPEELNGYVQKGHLASYASAVTGMNDFFRLKDAGAFPADVSGMSAELEHNMFYAGKAAIWTGGSWYWQELITQAPSLAPNIKLAGIPIPQGSKYTETDHEKCLHGQGCCRYSQWRQENGRGCEVHPSTYISPTTLPSSLKRQG